MKTEILKLIPGRDDVTLTSYLLDASPETLGEKSRPAVIVCPGGAYLNLSDREGEPVALAYARMGFHAFVLRYSVYGGNGFEMDLTTIEPDPAKTYPAPVRDIGRAFLTIREHAAEWHVDMGKIAICGFSAGAHNCAMYSVYWNKPVMTEYFGRPAADFKPAACILGYPLTDYIAMQASNEGNPFAADFFAGSNTAYLGTREPSDALLKEVSPAQQVDADTPPTFIWSTAEDGLVPVQQSILHAKALADHKIPFEIHIFQSGDHGFSLADESAAQARSQVSADASKWVSLSEAWLRKYLILPLPEMTPWEAMIREHMNAEQ